jgi:8-oxo-dGTP pyrophosphatase MutT (NUDIX family)
MRPSVARAHEIVSAVEPWDDLEVSQQADILSWLADGDDVFRRARPATPPRHLVSYVVLLDPASRSVLLVEHRDAGLHLPAGGHVEPGEDPAHTAIREASEELGIDASFLPALGARPLMVTQTRTVGVSAGHIDVSLWYVMERDAGVALDGDVREFAGWRWWMFEEVLAADPAVLDPHLPRFVAKLADLLTTPLSAAPSRPLDS